MVLQGAAQSVIAASGSPITRAYRERLGELLSQDLDFHDEDSAYSSHSLHAFPAKFPPQLPRKFIMALTDPGDVVLDPMMGSGTTVLEALLTGRHGIGVDIDPLAIMISHVKSTWFDVEEVARTGDRILEQARIGVRDERHELEEMLKERFDPETLQFVDRWFARETQMELTALIREIEVITNASLRAFFELAFSAIIITKSGGVSLALDLAHTRPHLAKVVTTKSGEVVLGNGSAIDGSGRTRVLAKTLRSALDEFERRFHQNLKVVLDRTSGGLRPQITFGHAERLSLSDASVDLIVTSPPYASNAIDYMRAHKFSLVWMGYCVDELSQMRKAYIGGEVTAGFDLEGLPPYTAALVASIAGLDEKKGRVLHRYYSDMARTLREMFRVLKPGKAAIVVVGDSKMRGRGTEIPGCLSEIGRGVGFEVAKIGQRNLDRNRRMLPAGSRLDLDSQIQQRMHNEYIIGFYKPQDVAWHPAPGRSE